MAFSDAVDNAMAVWFGDDFADQVTLNGAVVNAQVVEQGRNEDDNSVFDFIEVEIPLADYSTVAYRTDYLVYNGITWRYPREVGIDGMRTRIVRFIKNQRPKNARDRRL